MWKRALHHLPQEEECEHLATSQYLQSCGLRQYLDVDGVERMAHLPSEQHRRWGKQLPGGQEKAAGLKEFDHLLTRECRSYSLG